MSASLVSFSSSIASASSANSVVNLIEQWGNKSIASCVLGISKIGFTSNFSSKIAHSALLLLQKKIDYDEDDDEVILNETGIIIEYGDYNQNKYDIEKEYVKKGLVIYRYGEKGGLRYYVKKYKDFIKEFGGIGYVDLNIDENNQQSFSHFIDKIAKKEDNKWIQSNYSASFNFHCQTFTIEALKELKPYFNSSNIYPQNLELATKKSKKKLDFIPQNIKTELMNFYRR